MPAHWEHCCCFFWESDRASSDAQDFEKRLVSPGLLSSRAIRYCDEVVAILQEIGNAHLARAEIFPLLKVLHILSLDLATSTRQAEALMKSLLAFTATAQQKEDAADRTWNELIGRFDFALSQ